MTSAAVAAICWSLLLSETRDASSSSRCRAGVDASSSSRCRAGVDAPPLPVNTTTNKISYDRIATSWKNIAE